MVDPQKQIPRKHTLRRNTVNKVENQELSVSVGLCLYIHQSLSLCASPARLLRLHTSRNAQLSD